MHQTTKKAAIDNWDKSEAAELKFICDTRAWCLVVTSLAILVITTPSRLVAAVYAAACLTTPGTGCLPDGRRYTVTKNSGTTTAGMTLIDGITILCQNSRNAPVCA
jgi:hypothetical protein